MKLKKVPSLLLVITGALLKRSHRPPLFWRIATVTAEKCFGGPPISTSD
jgi:hypothetical protein